MIRIIAWNIRAGGGKRIVEIGQQLRQWQPDIVTLSEFRGTPPSQQLAQQLHALGLIHQLTTVDEQRPVTNALLLASRFPLQLKQTPVLFAPASRWLLANVATTPLLTIGSMHIPNYVTGLKHPFFDQIVTVVADWGDGLGLLLGDTNAGLPGIDEETRVFGRQEVAWFKALAAHGWVDTFRHLKGDERVFTWYSPNGRNGFRLDQAFANQALLPFIDDVTYHWGHSPTNPKRRDALSDHAALIVDLAWN